MRISFMILPQSLYELYQKKYQTFSQGVSKLEQLSLAFYLKEGLFYRHTKKLFNTYKKKNEVFREVIQEYIMDNTISLRGTDSNLHVVIDFKKQNSMDHFVKVCQLKNYKYTVIDENKSILFPYSGIENSEMVTIMNQLFTTKGNHQ